jgi:hypothetical protein
MVLTPGGYRHCSQVTRLGKDNAVSTEATPARDMLLHDAQLRDAQPDDDQPRDPPHPSPIPGHGWVAYTEWMNDKTDAIQLFTADWIVPPEPALKSGQTIFLFIGLQNTRFILQPVLQWGPSHAGGGAFWSIANWYTDGTKDHTFCSEALRVDPGKRLTTKIERTGQVGRSFRYKSSFEGFPELDIERDGVIELLWAFVVLEAYKVRDINNYPAAPMVQAASPKISRAAQVAPDWLTRPKPDIAGRPRAEVNPGGIDLVFR